MALGQPVLKYRPYGFVENNHHYLSSPYRHYFMLIGDIFGGEDSWIFWYVCILYFT